MQYGFVIDQNACIGCHACTVACKSENNVPVGSFRTWVKYTEQGRFPEVKRHFLVQRCNHCSDAPCVTICPVNALEKRPDGIVDVDRDACIGCRACMQACPYDAIYLNEDLGAVEKCHFCAHRVDRGLEPACVTVCPVGAIIPGDLDDPDSRASLTLLNHPTATRRAEQGTGPNVHYVGADEVSLHPGAASRPPTYIWSDRPPTKLDPWPQSLPLAPDAATVLDAGHRVEWGWPIAVYLVTKGVAGGAAMLAPFVGAAADVLALVFTLITVILLVGDLARPLRFYRLITRPNFDSWLVKGGILLGMLAAIACLAIVTGWALVRVGEGVLGAAAAAYTALLFAQCKGRDLWESRLLAPHLLAQALMCGGACLLALAPGAALKLVTAAAIAAHAALSIIEMRRTHSTDNARQAAAFLVTLRLGPFTAARDGLLIGAGLGLLCVLLLPWVAFVPVLAGLLLYEHAYVRAAQLPPLS